MNLVLRVGSAFVITASWLSSTAAANDTPKTDFEKHVAPILIKRCLECHNERDASGELVLDSHPAFLKGGQSGQVVVTGDPDESLLFEMVSGGDMPPEKKGVPQTLPKNEVETIRRWIAAGAKWPKDRKLDLYERTTDVRGGRDWWSLQPVKRPEVPTAKLANGEMAQPIDAFVLAKLGAESLQPAPLAGRRTLIRRVYSDLIGLPPSHAEIKAFLADESPDAYEKLVDRLLGSVHFGERWGRYWLDLVRFAETCGYERDQVKPNVWKYRDWVVKSLNDDKPYDRFVLEQLAGDELPDRDEQTVIATGFLRVGTWNDEPNDPQEYKYERLEDMVHATSSAFLGMTVKCARCHDHKFDPIPQLDYYRMATAFWAGFIEPRDSKHLGGPSKEELGYDVFGWTDRAREPPALHLLKKGDPHHPQQVVEPRQLSLVSYLNSDIALPPEDAKTSRRRLQLAQWIASPQNPLTARVIVNRLWQHHFGEGLVRTPNNFGFTGDQPTHPQLLDWLADELVRGGWKLKRLHKLMLMSRTYRQASVHPRQADYEKRDYENRLLWKSHRRRLDAETLRDAMLAVSGSLDLTTGGPSFKPTINPEALEGLSRKGGAWKASPQEQQNRRSLYIFTQRSLLVPLMTTFDFSDTTLPCAQRDVTTVAPQALALLNNEFVHCQSREIAGQVLKQGGEDRSAQVGAAWRRVFGRDPSPREAEAAVAHLEQQRRRFAQLLEQEQPDSGPTAESLAGIAGLVLNLRSDRGLRLDETGGAVSWEDTSGEAHHAMQVNELSRPKLVADAINGHPALRFDGKRSFLKLAGSVLASQQHTIIAVASDQGSGGHREIFSNWDGPGGNSVTSTFVGSTGGATVRFSDNFAAAGELRNQRQPFIISAVSGAHGAVVFQNGGQIARKDVPLTKRNLKPPYVIGRQGTLNGEYWNGDIAELLVFDRALSDDERELVEGYLRHRYGLQKEPAFPHDPELLALASLCHVLLNSNEFMYVD